VRYPSLPKCPYRLRAHAFDCAIAEES
jgi:hypothetical protein